MYIIKKYIQPQAFPTWFSSFCQHKNWTNITFLISSHLAITTKNCKVQHCFMCCKLQEIRNNNFVMIGLDCNQFTWLRNHHVEHLGFQKQYGDSILCVFNCVLLQGNGMFAAWYKEWFWLLLMCSSFLLHLPFFMNHLISF